MKALIQKRLKNQRGLTLIELLVVIVILGIIAAIAVPMVMDNRDSAETAVNEQTLKIVQDAADRYYTETGEYATDLTADGELVPNYLREAPACAGATEGSFSISGTGVVSHDCE